VTKPERKDGPLPLQPQAMVTDSLACVVPALRFQESQQVGVNGIGLGRGHAVRKAHSPCPQKEQGFPKTQHLVIGKIGRKKKTVLGFVKPRL
jgi:hypothetical protein